MILRDLGERLGGEMRKAVIGQDDAIEEMIVGLMAAGHVLLEGVPGTGKTLLTKALVRALGGEFRRIQFTPDLMPSDVLGTSVWDESRRDFTLRRGPIFADVVLGDEINRAPPKTQAAFLEAMEERQVTIDGQRIPLPEGFEVLARPSIGGPYHQRRQVVGNARRSQQAVLSQAARLVQITSVP